MLYAIGDLHLSFESDKPMDVFGQMWENHIERLKEGFSALKDEDVCVLCGDVTWSMSLENSLEDFKFIESLPGKKIVLKGNHDFWWSTVSKVKKFFAENDIKTIEILHNNCFFYQDVAICGTRGWFCEEGNQTEHDKKILNRELTRLELSLQAAGDCPNKLCFFHYPPRFHDSVCKEMVNLMRAYDVKSCWYGHIHGKGHQFARQGLIDGIHYTMVSADYLKFKPINIM